jgi:hypothetical protein
MTSNYTDALLSRTSDRSTGSLEYIKIIPSTFLNLSQVDPFFVFDPIASIIRSFLSFPF